MVQLQVAADHEVEVGGTDGRERVEQPAAVERFERPPSSARVRALPCMAKPPGQAFASARRQE